MLNWNGVMSNSMYYIEGYQLRNQEFMIVYINVLNITYYNQLHGKEVLTHMLQNVGEQISKYIGVTGVVGYIGMGKFVVLKQFENKEDMVKVKRELLAHISTVTQVDRISFTLRFNIGVCAFSETNDMELAYRLAQQRASKNYSVQEDDDVKQKIAEEMNKYQEIFDVVRCVDIDSYKTYILEDCKLKEVKKRCYEFFEKDHPCSSCIAKKALITHEEWAKIIYNGATHVVIARAMPIKGRNFVLIYTKKLNKES
jgi:GGDEF domain-containing protein